MSNPEMLGPATFTIGQTVASFFTFLPKFSEVRKANPNDNPDIAADVRMGEVAAVTVSMGVGIIASSLTSSPVPVTVTLVVCIILVVLYESTLCTNRPFESHLAVLTTRKGEAIA